MNGMSEHRKKRSSGSGTLRIRQGSAENLVLDRSPQNQNRHCYERGKMTHSQGKGGVTRQPSYDHVRKIVQEEGREARNLITWSVPVETDEPGQGLTRKVVAKPSRTNAKVWQVRSSSANLPQQRGKGLPGGLSRSRDITPPADAKKSSQEVGSNGGRLSGVGAVTPKKAGPRARYWAFLFDNLERAVEMIYQTCETDESVVECKEAIMRLEQCTKDFKSLILRFNLLKVYETAEVGHKPTSLAWDVRKSSPVKNLTGGAPKEKFAHSPSSASRSLDFCQSVSSGQRSTATSGGSWADRVRGGPTCPPHSTSPVPDDHPPSQEETMSDGDEATQVDTEQQATEDDDEHAAVEEDGTDDMDGWETVHHGRRPTSGIRQRTERPRSRAASEDSEKENRPAGGATSLPVFDSTSDTMLGTLPASQCAASMHVDAVGITADDVHADDMSPTYSPSDVQHRDACPQDDSLSDDDEMDDELTTSLESALVCALDEEENLSERLEHEQTQALRSAIKQEQTYLNEIALEQSTAIEVDEDEDDDEVTPGGSLDDDRRDGSCDSPQQQVDKAVGTHDDVRKCEPRLWSDIMDEEEESSRVPGHGIHMHEKLSSPSRKKSLNEKRRQHEEKQAKAQELREKLLYEKAERLRLLTSKVEEVRAWKDELLRQNRDTIEDKLQRAEEKRQLQLQMKIRKAHEEETKANEIAFINSLEAQNKRHDIMSKHQESKARLLDLQEERQRKCEEKAAKEAAAEERRRALHADRCARLQEMAERRRQREADFEQRQHVRETQRVQTARARELEHEERKAALNAQKQEHIVQLQRKIQHRQDETDRRYKKKLDKIREKAFEMSVLRHSTEDHNEAPQIVPYEQKKFCSVCNVMIPSEVYLLGHLRGKKHQQALMESNGGKALSKQQIELFNLAHIADAPNDAADPQILLERERQKSLRKRCKKLRQRMTFRGAEYETFLSSKQQLVDSPQRTKLQKLSKDLSKYLNCSDSGPWPQSRVSALDRATGELARILDKKVLSEQNTLRVCGGLTTLSRLLLVITQSTPGGAAVIPNKSLLNICTVLRLGCKGCYDNCHYMLFTNKMGYLVDQLIYRLNMSMDGSPSTVQSPADSVMQQTAAGRVAADPVAGALMQLVATTLTCLAKHNPGVNSSVASAERMTATGDAFMSRVNDIVSYIISVGLVDRLSTCLGSVRGPDDTDTQVAEFLLHSVGLITAMIRVVACRRTGVFDKSVSDTTQLLATFGATDLVGIVSLTYGLLLHSAAPPRGDSPPPELPGHILSVIMAAFRMLNHLATLDLNLLQGSMSGEATSLEFRHIASYLLWYSSHWTSTELLHEVILSIGYFTVLNPDNQLFIQSGQSPTVLQQLCALPFQYFSSPHLSAVLFPTLIACCYGSQPNLDIVQQELSCTLLASFIEEKSLEAQNKTLATGGKKKTKSQDKDDGRMSLACRLPPQEWSKAQAYFQC